MRPIGKQHHGIRGGWGARRIHRRLLVLRASEKTGDVIEWVCTGSRPALLSLALAAAGLIWLDWWALLLLYAGLLLAWFAAKAKTRIVIETFEDHTSPALPMNGSGDRAASKDQSDPHRLDTSGMAGLLATKLAEMRDMYQLLEEPLGRPHPGPVEGAVQLEDIGDVLRSAFTTQSNLSIGPITLPFGSVMALLGRLMQAPRLRGAIYGDDTDLTLTASLTMPGRDYVWSVPASVGEDGTLAHTRTKMVAELAYRVFTDLSLRGQAEWPATRDWLDALRERQACQRSPRDRRRHLEQAETHLRNALAEDERFYLAAYNLGIVYRQLAEEDAKRGRVADTDERLALDDVVRGVRDEPHTRSALRVFAYAIERLDRGRWEAYYGAALADWKLVELWVGDRRRRLIRVVDHCDRALDLASDRAPRAQIQDLKALTQQELGLNDAALQTWQSACRAILRELALTQLWRVPRDDQRILRLRKQASQCLLNLAIAYDKVEPAERVRKPSDGWIQRWRRNRRFARIRALTGLAVKLADLDAAAHEKFAEIAERWEELDVARGELHHAIRIEQDNPTYWAMLAEVSAKKAHDIAEQTQQAPTVKKGRDASVETDRDAALFACRAAEAAIDFGSIDFASEAERQAIGHAIDRLTRAYDLLGEREAAGAVASRRELGRAITAALAPADPFAGCKSLGELLSQYEDQRLDWEVAIIQRHLGERLLQSSTAIGDAVASDSSGRAADELGELLRRCERDGRGRTPRIDREPARQHGTQRVQREGAIASGERRVAAGGELAGRVSRQDVGEALAHAAEELFADATARLKRSKHAVDIRRWGLLGRQAAAITRQVDRTGEALPLAEDGVAIDPLSSQAWRALALVREHGGDYKGACTAWGRVELLEPEEPECRVALALCQWQHAIWVADPAEQQSLRSAALANLHAARELYDVAQMEDRRRVEWWAAKCHWRLGQFAQMPSHLRFIVASLESVEPKPEDRALSALVELVLAQSYRQTRQFADAEWYAQRAMDDADRAAADHFPADVSPGAPFSDTQWSLGAIRALARGELAGCHADRSGVSDSDTALCDKADALAQELGPLEATEIQSELSTERGRVELARGHPREAVNLLERATTTDPHSAGSYVSLALAYERLTAEQQDRHEVALTLQKAHNCCRLAKEIVGEGHLQWMAADKIEQRLEATRRPPVCV